MSRWHLQDFGIDPGELESAAFDRDLSAILEALLREAADRLDLEMRNLRARHMDAAEKLKGTIVPKTDHFGRPVFSENGRPRNQRLVFWYEIRFERMKPRPNGLTFPNLYWFKRTGGQVIVQSGAVRGKKVCRGDRLRLPESGFRYPIGLFTAANVRERELIEKTEAHAEPLRAQARYYSDLWMKVRSYRQSAQFLARFPKSMLERAS